MLYKCHWIVLYRPIVQFTAFCLGGPFLSGHSVEGGSENFEILPDGAEFR